MKLLLKFLSFKKFKKIYKNIIKTNDESQLSESAILKYVWAIRMASVLLSAVCLPQALALKYFLRKDKSAKIIIGVNTQLDTNNSTTLLAHAWVEKNHKILIGDLPNIHYMPIWILE